MRIIRSVVDMQCEADRLRLAGKQIALVPTMGYLHQGHVSLIEYAKGKGQVVILSIFVNPTQFGPNEDFERYPRDSARDERIANEAGVNIVFEPDASEMYPGDFRTFVDEQEASHILEGRIRPSHFRGVATVVAKLFNICRPNVAVFGQKDIQQAFIIKRMVRDLNFDVLIEVRPIVREPDGLAMSSRNIYLSGKDRSSAIVLIESLRLAERRMRSGEKNITRLRTEMEQMIHAKGVSSVDYVAFLDPATFIEIEVPATSQVIVAIAVRLGSTRLIDNIIVALNPPNN
jgi:pantoate--beta-alanine ligase